MEGDLFSKPPGYTIDACSLMDIFAKEKIVSRDIIPGLWERVAALLEDGTIISHIEVLKEINTQEGKGQELYDWAHAHWTIFKDYEWEREGVVIRSMAPKYSAFVNGKDKSIHADPWLVAQGKVRGVKVITEERPSASPKPKNHKLPNVCNAFGVECVDLLGLVKEQGWSFR
jgi:hypothetical protein